MLPSKFDDGHQSGCDDNPKRGVLSIQVLPVESKKSNIKAPMAVSMTTSSDSAPLCRLEAVLSRLAALSFRHCHITPELSVARSTRAFAPPQAARTLSSSAAPAAFGGRRLERGVRRGCSPLLELLKTITV